MQCNWSVPEETISSKPDRISSLGNGNFRRSGEGLSCFGWVKLQLGRGGGNGASVLSQKDAIPWSPIGSQGRESVCPAGLGAGGASSRSFHLDSLCCRCPAQAQEISQNLVCRKSHHLHIPVPPSTPSGTFLQQGSRRVWIGKPNLTKGNQAKKNNSMLANKRIGLKATAHVYEKSQPTSHC